jgi:hypothetical protein
MGPVAPHVDSYRFGRIVVNGTAYRHDVILLPDRVEHPWWRTAGGHVFAEVDLGPLLECGAEVVVLGVGAVGMVRVPAATLEAFAARGAEVVSARTGQAVERFNELAAAGRVVAAGLHLTC